MSVREVKFRGLTKASDDWVYGDLIQRTADFIFPAGVYTTKIYEYLIEIRPETKGQYIGLQDKNGIDIYEGDIIKGKAIKKEGEFDYFGVVEIVTQSNVHGVFLQEPMYGKDFSGGWRIDQLQAKISLNNITGEIIGNIYEHAHLLKE